MMVLKLGDPHTPTFLLPYSQTCGYSFGAKFSRVGNIGKALDHEEGAAQGVQGTRFQACESDEKIKLDMVTVRTQDAVGLSHPVLSICCCVVCSSAG